ncbi:MAG: hypothetical protein K0S98_1494 [Propionibacteriaceae bacterium]|nr:hypothetical protein [Propionibacteriaceae bacterium]
MRPAPRSSERFCRIAGPGWFPGERSRWAVAGRDRSSIRSGEATSSGTVLPWKFILKMFSHEGEGWQETSTDPMAWDFWKREWLVYQAPWIRDLQEGLVAPRCFGSGKLAETAVWVAIEDLTAADQRPWSLSRFAAAARHLGEFNGRFLVGSGQPTDWWLSRGWPRGWTERAEPMITQLPSLAEHPVVAELFAPSTIGLLLGFGSIGVTCTTRSTHFRSPSVIKTCFPVTPSSASPAVRSRRLRSTGRFAAQRPWAPIWRPVPQSSGRSRGGFESGRIAQVGRRLLGVRCSVRVVCDAVMPARSAASWPSRRHRRGADRTGHGL